MTTFTMSRSARARVTLLTGAAFACVAAPQAAYALRAAAESGDPELVSAANGQEAAA
jgi:hypothetical protein